MFNLLVSGVAGAWEGAYLDMDLDRFNVDSGKLGHTINPDDPASLRQLNGTVALIMYELGFIGPNSQIVRHGRLHNVARYGQVVSCQVELDTKRPYLQREKIVEFARHLNMQSFEQGQTHWAIKDGDLPPALLECAISELPAERAETEGKPETLVNGITVLPDGARVVALIVALESYRAGGQQIESVVFAEADATAFRQAIETAFTDDRPEIRLLANSDATYSDLINAIAELAYGLGPDDLFIFYYAGHGFHDDSGNRLTVWDTTLVNVAGTTVGVNEHLLGPLRKGSCQRVLAFIDACASRFKPMGRKTITDLDPDEFRQFLKSAAFNAVFLSCRSGEQSFPDSDLNHGIWTYYLLRALNGQAPDAIDQRGYITNVTLQDYLRQEVPRHVANHPRIKASQNPEAIITATSTFAIRQVAVAKPVGSAPQVAQPSGLAASVMNLAVPDHARYAGSSTEFFARRFARAFPGVRTIQWFNDKAAIRMRLLRLLEAPLIFDHTTPIWQWRGGNLQIKSFSVQPNELYLMDFTELDVRRIAAVPGPVYWQSFVYVEASALPPSGAYNPNLESSSLAVKTYGYDSEEYGLVDGHHVVTRSELDDGAAMIGHEIQDINNRSDLRIRHLTPYNFLIAANGSPINNHTFDQILVKHLNRILQTGDGLDELAAEIWRLRRPPQFKEE